MNPELTMPGTDTRLEKEYFFEMTPLRRVLTPILRRLYSLFARLEVEGVENLPASGPVILAANHLTNYDVFPMQFALPRLIFYMGKAELFQNPLMDVVLRNLGGFPVYRGEHDAWAMEHAALVLEHGQVLGIFPEGKRTKGRGLAAGKTGAARLAIEMDCPIVPLAHTGDTDLFKPHLRRAQVKIKIGPAIYPEPADTPLSLTDRVMFELAALLPPELRGVYAQRPKGF